MIYLFLINLSFLILPWVYLDGNRLQPPSLSFYVELRPQAELYFVYKISEHVKHDQYM